MARRTQKDTHYSDSEPEDDSFAEEQEVSEAPPSIDPYAVLGLDTEAAIEDVRKAYKKMALKHHPDKSPDADKTAANQKFQEIAFAYAILSDERRRKRYDLTGSTAETLDHDDEDFDWLSFYREQFENVVTEEAIKNIENEYKGSGEERNDVLKAYTTAKGNLDQIYGWVMLSDILVDDERFRKIIDEEIEKGTIESYRIYERMNNDAAREKAKQSETKRRADFDKRNGTFKEASENAKAKLASKDKKAPAAGGDMASLAALIQGRQKARMGPAFFANLEAKYAPTSKPARGKKRATPMDDEPTEEEFLAARKRLQTAGKSKKVIESEDEEDDGEDIDMDSEDEFDSASDIDEDEEVEEEEEEPTPPPQKSKKRGTATKGVEKTKKCKFFSVGKCSKGDACPFIHE